MTARPAAIVALCLSLLALCSQAAGLDPDAALRSYFAAETSRVADASLAGINSADEWKTRREEFRREAFEMFGLWPVPERTDLKAVVTGKVDHPEFTVEKVHFQSMPGLYVTGNLYVPKKLTSPAPTVLYVCGHGPVIKDGVSYGNKVTYQHHGIWFARHGYVCLLIDTLQLGEIQGLHHGTYREGMWWWNSRGYTPAGVEAWNSIRALDYLETRPEVDKTRFGVTGRSGGGAYSWFLTALDDRVKVSAPVAGITDLHNHVVGGAVEGHCDCMFIVNTFRWDYPLLAALMAPRPLLICNSDKDWIFPLDGVMRTHSKVAGVYRLLNATNNLGVLITEGPHKDTQDLQVPVFRWFNRHLKGEDPVIEIAATKLFQPEQLKVFDKLPANERNTRIQETFVPIAAVPSVPPSRESWAKQRDAWMTALKEKVFRGWPTDEAPVTARKVLEEQRDGVRARLYAFESQTDVPLLFVAIDNPRVTNPTNVVLSIPDAEKWLESDDEWILDLLAKFTGKPGRSAVANAGTEHAISAGELEREQMVMIVFAPRGIGPLAWSGDQKKQAHLRRRFMLLGQTVDGMRVWDIRRAVQGVRSIREFQSANVRVASSGEMAVNALYASLFEPDIRQLSLVGMPGSHREGPDYMNVLRFLDIPQALAMAAERTHLSLTLNDDDRWRYPMEVMTRFGWGTNRLKANSLLGN